MAERTVEEILKALKAKYSDDADALDEISRREKDIEYIKGREKDVNYSGQTSLSMAKMLEADLEYWQ